MRGTLAFLPILLIPALAAAETYRWVDAQGQLHYSQTPPPGIKATALAPPAPPATSPNQDALNQSLEKSNADEAKHKGEVQSAAALQQQQVADCQNVRNQLAQIEVAGNARRLSTRDDKGNVSRMSQEEFERRRTEAQQYLREKCGS